MAIQGRGISEKVGKSDGKGRAILEYGGGVGGSKRNQKSGPEWGWDGVRWLSHELRKRTRKSRPTQAINDMDCAEKMEKGRAYQGGVGHGRGLDFFPRACSIMGNSVWRKGASSKPDGEYEYSQSGAAAGT